MVIRVVRLGSDCVEGEGLAASTQAAPMSIGKEALRELQPRAPKAT